MDEKELAKRFSNMFDRDEESLFQAAQELAALYVKGGVDVDDATDAVISYRRKLTDARQGLVICLMGALGDIHD